MPWTSALLTETQNYVFPYFENPNAYTTARFGERALEGVADTVVGIGIAGWLLLAGTIFVYLAGIAQTAMLIVVPILAVLSFAPLFHDSLKNWAKNFVGISVIRFFFNLMGAIAAYVNLTPNSADPITFPAIMALMSLAFSFQLFNSLGPELIGAQARLVAGVPLGLAATRRLLSR